MRREASGRRARLRARVLECVKFWRSDRSCGVAALARRGGAADPVVRAERNVGADRRPTHAHGGCGAHVVMGKQPIATMQEAMARRQAEQEKENAEIASSREKKMRASINDVVAELLCPINRELPFDPVLAEDGKIYERDAILKWFAKKAGDATSPSTGAVIGTKLLPAVQVRNTIESLIQTGAIEGEIAEAWQEASAKKRADETKVKETRAKAEGGDGYAMYLLGLWYRSGRGGLAQDAVQSRAWLERSAAARDPRGLAYFGCCLLNGIGGPQDIAFGLVNVTEAAGLGSDFAAYILGEAFFVGKYNLPKDPVRARFWIKKVADGECKIKHLNDAGLAEAAAWLRELDG